MQNLPKWFRFGRDRKINTDIFYSTLTVGSIPTSPTIMKTGYKEMLRNRLPDYVDLALKWCKVKELWINHVYDSQINIYADKQERYNATRIILGLSSKERVFKFEDSIDWVWITEEEKARIRPVIGWINFFKTIFPYIENKWKVNLSLGKTEQEFIDELSSGYLKTVNDSVRNKLAVFITNYLKK